MNRGSSVEKALRALINSLPAGSKLPGVRKLAKELGSSPVTVDKILARFQSEGLIRRLPRSGTYVEKSNIPEEIPFLMPLTLDEFTYRVLRGLYQKGLNVKAIPVEFFSENLCKSEYVIFLPESIHIRSIDVNIQITNRLRREGKKVVFVDRRTTEDAISVTFDNEKAGEKVGKVIIEKLKNAEHRKVLYIASPGRAYTTELRLLGLKKILEENGWAVYEHKSPLEELTPEHLKEIDVVVGSDDATSEKILIYLLQKGFKIPDEIRLVSIGGFFLLKELPVKITSLSLPVEELGKEAARAVIEKLKPPAEILIEPGDFIEGDTF